MKLQAKQRLLAEEQYPDWVEEVETVVQPLLMYCSSVRKDCTDEGCELRLTAKAFAVGGLRSEADEKLDDFLQENELKLVVISAATEGMVEVIISN